MNQQQSSKPTTKQKPWRTVLKNLLNYFLNKMKTIRKLFENTEQYTPSPSNVPPFKRLASLTEDEVKNEIFNMTTKTCKLDPIPIDLLKQLLPKYFCTFMQIVNMSLTQGVFSNEWNTAIVRPLLKKAGLDLVHKNYRPVSNLCFHLKSSGKGACYAN